MKVNVLLLNSIIISLISGCTFFPDVEVDDISHIESEIYNPAYTECMDDDMTKTQIFNNKNNDMIFFLPEYSGLITYFMLVKNKYKKRN